MWKKASSAIASACTGGKRFLFSRVALVLIFGVVIARVLAESPDQWYRDGRDAVARARQLEPITGKAKNVILDRKSTRLNSSHIQKSRMPSSA